MSEELPPGWRHVVLGDVAESWLGKMLDRQKHTAGNALPYLRNQNVRWFGVDLSDVSAMFFEDRELDRYGLRAGDVLVCEGGEPGRAAIWDGRSPDMKFQKAIHRVRPSGLLLPEWLVFHLFHDAQSGGLERYFTGTTIKHFTGTALAKYEIPLPPPKEQRRIVAKLEALQARSRRAREALDAVPPLLEKLRQSILAAAFRGDLTKDWRAQQKDLEPAAELLKRIRTARRQKWESTELAKLKSKGKPPTDDMWKSTYVEPVPAGDSELSELPRGWCWASVDELLAEGLANGRSVLTDDAGFPVLRLTALKHGKIDLSERKGGAWSADQAAPFVVRKNDFLVSRGNGSLALVGRGGLVEHEPDAVAFPDTLIRIRVQELVDLGYFARIWSANVVRSQIERSAKTTAGIFKISQGDIERIAIPVPSVAEQRAITHALSTSLDRVRELEVTLDAMVTTAASLERSVLAKAFRGELVPQDPNEEPAEAMLARARSTSGSAPANGTPQKRGRPRSPQRADQPND